MDLSLKGKSAVIVGAAQGIGRAIAEAFAAEGTSVGLVDRDPGVATSAEDIASRHNVEAFAVVADVTSDSVMGEAAESLRSELGRLDHVVFTAGIGSGKFGYPFSNLDPADWQPVWNVNVLGAVHTAHAFSPHLISAARSDPAHGATFLCLVSVAGQIGSQTDPPYSAAKAAQINFMQCLAKDLAPEGVRVNALSPGMVRTALNESVWAAGQALLPEDERQDYATWAKQKIQQVSPLGRWQEPEEFGGAATYLASPYARNITGQTINIDGGQVMHS